MFQHLQSNVHSVRSGLSETFSHRPVHTYKVLAFVRPYFWFSFPLGCSGSRHGGDCTVNFVVSYLHLTACGRGQGLNMFSTNLLATKCNKFPSLNAQSRPSC